MTLVTPRPMPSKALPIAAALGGLALALPIFLLAEWPLEPWGIAALLYVGLRALGLVFDRAGTAAGRFWMVGRVVVVTAVLLALLGTDVDRALAAALVYAAAYTLELAVSLFLYFGQEPAR
jgi:hypothetical protein